MKRHIPNIITCCNLVSGCIATHFAFSGDYRLALGFIVLGAVFDFFDGFAARLLGVSSPIGKELDSLADDITFGFAPSAMAFSLMQSLCTPQSGLPLAQLLPYGAFLLAAFSALRLAKFNLDERQALGFIGLPTPANALFWAALVLTVSANTVELPVYTPFILLLLVLLSCFFLVCEIPMFALKFKHYSWRGNEQRYCFVLLSAVLLALLGWGGFIAIVPLYIACSALVLPSRKS